MSESGPYFRAHQPSIQSVAVAMRKMMSPTSHHACTMQANTPTASGMRTNESRFGTFQMGDEGGGVGGEFETAVDDASGRGCSFIIAPRLLAFVRHLSAASPPFCLP